MATVFRDRPLTVCRSGCGAAVEFGSCDVCELLEDVHRRLVARPVFLRLELGNGLLLVRVEECVGARSARDRSRSPPQAAWSDDDSS
jgi:hypothetical protein